MTQAALLSLARTRGLGDAYHDYRGEFREFTAEAKTAILSAMGIDVHDAAAIALAAKHQDAVEWKRLLEPVYVRTAAESIGVDISLPVDANVHSLQWIVITEDGGEIRGTLGIADMQETGRAVIDKRLYVRKTVVLEGCNNLGYHQLSVACDTGLAANASLIVTPERCYEPVAIERQEKLWGIAVQLYTLRTERNWGMGDFGDLRDLVERSAAVGCSVIGVNPLHALMPANPLQISPYSPSSRQFLNVLYIDVTQVSDFKDSKNACDFVAQGSVQARLKKLRETWNVDYAGVAALKLTALRLAYAHFRAVHLASGSAHAVAFRKYVADRGVSLMHHATFDALDAHFRQQGPQYWGWPSWPAEYAHPDSPQVRRFATERTDEVEFFLYLQWLAEDQLTQTQRFARELGMSIGIYGDVAVGVNPGGSETWSNRQLYLQGVSVGAPPDPLALKGQDWGIPPQDPSELREQGYVPFVTMLRNNMRAVGALRLDHVMALCRLWWVPRGFSATEGVYVRYPIEDLMRILALESVRNRCLVIGEDLGTVPDEMREAMERFHVYHYNVLLFEKEADGRFKAPHRYVEQSLASVTTHDLPPLKSWWEGLDIELRTELGVYPSDAVRDQEIERRRADRRALMEAIVEAGLWYWSSHDRLPDFSHALMRAIHLYLGFSSARLAVVQLEDLIGMTDPVNVPGTDKEHANWQRKITQRLGELFGNPEVLEALQAMGKARRGESPNA